MRKVLTIHSPEMIGWKTYKNCTPEFDIHIDTTIVTFPLPSKPKENTIKKTSNSKQHPPSSGNLKNLTDDQPSDTIGKTSEKQLHTDDYGRLRTITDDYGRLRTIKRVREANSSIHTNKSITRQDAINLLNLQKTKIHELLSGLSAKGYIEKQGKARNTFYTLIEKKIRH